MAGSKLYNNGHSLPRCNIVFYLLIVCSIFSSGWRNAESVWRTSLWWTLTLVSHTWQRKGQSVQHVTQQEMEKLNVPNNQVLSRIHGHQKQWIYPKDLLILTLLNIQRILGKTHTWRSPVLVPQSSRGHSPRFSVEFPFVREPCRNFAAIFIARETNLNSALYRAPSCMYAFQTLK